MMISIIVFSFLCSLSLVRADRSCSAANAISMSQYYSGEFTTGSSSSGSSSSESSSSESSSSGSSSPGSSAAAEVESSFIDATGENVDYLTDSRKKRFLWPRASTPLRCTDNEICAELMMNAYMCFNQNTGDFHDNYGGTGNINSWTYTMSDGEVTRIATTALYIPTPTSTGSAAKNTATLAEAAARTTSANSAAASGSGSSAAARFEMNDLLRTASFMMAAAGLWLF